MKIFTFAHKQELHSISTLAPSYELALDFIEKCGINIMEYDFEAFSQAVLIIR